MICTYCLEYVKETEDPLIDADDTLGIGVMPVLVELTQIKSTGNPRSRKVGTANE